MPDAPTVSFLGAAGTVTGSKHLVTAAGRQVLLDCGLFQGLKALRLRNWQPPELDPAALDAVVLSHAHIDHSGYLPLLVRRGFRGPVHCTPPTADLLRILLLDAAHLQEEEAEVANRYGYSKHHPALPLFTTADAEAALARVETRPFGTPFPVSNGMSALFRRAGHILGAATVELRLGARPLRLVFSGDLGRPHRPILRDPEPVPEADVLLVESTYGDRVHAPDPEGELARVVHEAIARGGALLVPAFAVGRAQELLWLLRTLEDAGRIPRVPVFLDSPMAISVTEVYARHPGEHDAASGGLSLVSHHLVRTPQESKALNDRSGFLIVIAGSGMATGGRILHHLKRRLPDDRTTVLLPGFQAAGTRGRSLQDGAHTLRMHGQDVPVRARVVTLDGLSAHADRDEILAWLAGFARPPRRVHVVHGEPAAAASLTAAVRARFGCTVVVAEDGQTVPLQVGEA
jgi:metallo-beta-lactamase family protein